MSENTRTISTHKRSDLKAVVEGVQKMSSLQQLLAACVIEAGGSIDVSYVSLGRASLEDVVVLLAADNSGITVQLEQK